MYLRFEHFAATSMLGDKAPPPRQNGKLFFENAWERAAFGVAIALAKKGHYEWEDFRQELIDAIAAWEKEHALTDSSWDYYERWLQALERLATQTGLIDSQELESYTTALIGDQRDPTRSGRTNGGE
ncbi:nitrile hydratase accessory protein [Methylohalobius crimeensis]|uniref:nitrile hydratase accessory protein n=1 Tax=Methylohalobius crimeensis TaxID=244365 RepID=UPI0003B557F0|nr:nitrile hydratase accessory protein [Methylohalobius crimeensis]